MPTYEYRCPSGHQFEKFQRMSEPPAAQCPACGKEAERMLSGGAGLLFKGDGFYITDYRSDSYKKAAKKESGGDSSGGDKSAGGSKEGGSKSSGGSSEGGSKPSGGSGKKGAE
jgi:putative FmdB family regulatory protein